MDNNNTTKTWMRRLAVFLPEDAVINYHGGVDGQAMVSVQAKGQPRRYCGIDLGVIDTMDNQTLASVARQLIG